jgi:hypothetical protein
VAELVHDQVVCGATVAQQDRPVKRIPVEAPQPRQPEEPGGDEDADALDPYGLRIPVEPVEPRLRAGECVAVLVAQEGGSSCRIASRPPIVW